MNTIQVNPPINNVAGNSKPSTPASQSVRSRDNLWHSSQGRWGDEQSLTPLYHATTYHQVERHVGIHKPGYSARGGLTCYARHSVNACVLSGLLNGLLHGTAESVHLLEMLRIGHSQLSA